MTKNISILFSLFILLAGGVNARGGQESTLIQFNRLDKSGSVSFVRIFVTETRVILRGTISAVYEIQPDEVARLIRFGAMSFQGTVTEIEDGGLLAITWNVRTLGEEHHLHIIATEFRSTERMRRSLAFLSEVEAAVGLQNGEIVKAVDSLVRLP